MWHKIQGLVCDVSYFQMKICRQKTRMLKQCNMESKESYRKGFLSQGSNGNLWMCKECRGGGKTWQVSSGGQENISVFYRLYYGRENCLHCLSWYTLTLKESSESQVCLECQHQSIPANYKSLKCYDCTATF